MKTRVFTLTAGILLGILIMFLIRNSKEESNQVEISHNMIIEKIESLGNLEVTKYSIQDMMEYKKVRRWLPNAKTALIVSGEVICCVDLTKLKPEDIIVTGKRITLKLPQPEICHVKIDHSKSRVYDIEYGFWESAKIADEAYKAAERELNDKARQMDIISQSRSNAANLLRPILLAMGFDEVVITYYPSQRNG